ncbi:MAG: TetR/AcrR family transcriptional regulator [Acidobacteria bacterium]|nr:TetR/AcrR family transcriptional regulator [Acidobacteriota bacterium]
MPKAKRLLTREDWIEAAIDQLAVAGFDGLAVEPLARKLHVSKGSFYWHFRDRGDLISAVLAAWKSRGFTSVIARLSAIAGPRERLAALIDAAWTAPARLRAESAIVSAALAGDRKAIPVVREVTSGRLAYIRAIYAEMGLSPEQAASWALTAYSAYAGAVHLAALGTVASEAQIRTLAAHLEGILIPARNPNRLAAPRKK